MSLRLSRSLNAALHFLHSTPSNLHTSVHDAPLPATASRYAHARERQVDCALFGAWTATRKRNEVARRIFSQRFPDVPTGGVSIEQLREMKGRRVKQIYQDLGHQYGFNSKGRNYSASSLCIADNINRELHTTTGS